MKNIKKKLRFKQSNITGFTIYITGLSGCGKTTLAKKIKKFLIKKKIDVLEISGDDIRAIFDLNKFDLNSRKKYLTNYSKLCHFLNSQGVNVILSTSGFNKTIRDWNCENLYNYYEIYISSEFNINKKFSNKPFLKSKKNLWGYDLNPEVPKNPDLIIYNDFSKNVPSTFDKHLLKIYNSIS